MDIARNRLRRWTASDDRELRRLFGLGATASAASAVLGRSVDSVWDRMKSLGLSRRRKNR